MQTGALQDRAPYRTTEREWRLLVVDDCREDREAYRRYLLADRTKSYQICEAESAEVALQLCRERHWDVVLLDLQLPDMSGLEVWERLRANGNVRPPATILLTAFGDEQTAVRALKSGISDYIIKQKLGPDTLRWAVRAAIDQARLQARLQAVRSQRQLIAGLALRVCRGMDLPETLAATVAEVRDLLACERVAVFQTSAQADTSTLVCEARIRRNAGEPHRQTDSEAMAEYRGGGATLGALSAGFSPAQRAYLRQFTHETAWALPIAWEELYCEGNARLWGVLVACRESGQWHSDEVELLEELATQLAIAARHTEMLARLETALARERELNAVKSQIVTTISHEYRTPLAAILAAATTLKTHDRQLSNSMQQHLLATIELKAKHLGQLVEDMLLVDRHSRDCQPLQLECIHPGRFFSTLLEEQRLVDSSARDRVALSFSGDLDNFWADPKLLTQIFENLLSNALKYSAADREAVVRVMGSEAQLTVTISDCGIGIPAADLSQIGQSFVRGGNVGTTPGTGLGLFIAQTCIDLHGGSIEIASTEGVGTTITVDLPKHH